MHTKLEMYLCSLSMMKQLHAKETCEVIEIIVIKLEIDKSIQNHMFQNNFQIFKKCLCNKWKAYLVFLHSSQTLHAFHLELQWVAQHHCLANFSSCLPCLLPQLLLFCSFSWLESSSSSQVQIFSSLWTQHFSNLLHLGLPSLQHPNYCHTVEFLQPEVY